MTRHRFSTLVIFARRPRLGQGKRRLAADVGDVAAWRFCRGNLATLLRAVAGDSRWRVVIAVTPDQSSRREVAGATSKGVKLLGQGQGDLGQRMGQALARASAFGPVVLIGVDIPGVTARHIARAFAILGPHDAVFGPAEDGGFWLVGVRRTRRIPSTLFQGCRWSSPHALADAVATVPSTWSVGFATEMADVDTGTDLIRISRANQLTGQFTGQFTRK